MFRLDFYQFEDLTCQYRLKSSDKAMGAPRYCGLTVALIMAL